jgi:uncharacterized protein (DUF58 family)
MEITDIKAPARGPYTELETLIAQRFPAGQINLGRRKRALSALAGPNKTNFRGRGIDFEEVRFYQPGDDIRTIDWRVTARTGEAHTKLFREERERPVLIVTDQRSNMFFGSRHCFKSVLACQLAALLAWSALDKGDRIGGLVFNEQGHRDIRPRRSRKTVLALMSLLHDYNHALPGHDDTAAATFAQMLGKLRRVAKPGSSVFLISDFHGSEAASASNYLYQLAQHTEITAIHCSDPLESELPVAGRYTVTDGNIRSRLYTADKQLRQRYHQDFEGRQQRLASDLQQLGIPLLHATTDRSPLDLLMQYYGDNRR